MTDKRLADYFVVVGLNEKTPNVLQPCSDFDEIEPIVDIILIRPSQGESPPDGYTCIESTPTGYKASLNHGSLIAPEIFLCYKKSKTLPCILDIGVVNPSRNVTEHEVITMTSTGHSANISNSAMEKLYISFLRSSNSPSIEDEIAIIDICIVLLDKSESIPYYYDHIEKSLNTGMIGSKVILCYKKSRIRKNCVAYNAEILKRYPLKNLPSFPLSQQIGLFCLPSGGLIERHTLNHSKQNIPKFSTFVLTLETGQKYFGTAVQFQVEIIDKIFIETLKKMFVHNPDKSLGVDKICYLQNQAICIISQWPFFHVFKKFLLYLYRISVSGPQLISLERYISHFMNDIPFPSIQYPCVTVQLNTDQVIITQPEESPIPISGASFIIFLLRLGPIKCIHLMLLVLLEHKILLHSNHLDLLTYIAEALIRIVFPLNWPYPYIPLCPMVLATVLESPTPFIVGINSEYFDTNFPLAEVTYVNVDSMSIKLPTERKEDTLKILPKKLLTKLQTGLERLQTDLLGDDVFAAILNEKADSNFIAAAEQIDCNRLKSYEMSIQECFLRFMAGLLKDYNKFLLPITERSMENGVDVQKLFDTNAFLKSHDRQVRPFLEQITASQSFSRLIEERSLGAHAGTLALNFFDDCLTQLGSKEKWLFVEINPLSERTVIVNAPEGANHEPEFYFNYDGFGSLRAELFPISTGPKVTSNETILCRTKQEISNARRVLQSRKNEAEFFAKSMASNIYGLWFMTLPSQMNTNNRENRQVLKKALNILSRMHAFKLPCLDQLSYRVLFHLSIAYNLPVVAVRTYYEMKKMHVEPNATTYAFYNTAMLQGTWSSAGLDSIRWRKLSNVIFAAARFKRAPYIEGDDVEDEFLTQSQYALDQNHLCSELGLHQNLSSSSSSASEIRRYSEVAQKSKSCDLLEAMDGSEAKEKNNPFKIKMATNQTQGSFENLYRLAKNRVSSTYNNIRQSIMEGKSKLPVEYIELGGKMDVVVLNGGAAVDQNIEEETELDRIIVPAPDSEDEDHAGAKFDDFLSQQTEKKEDHVRTKLNDTLSQQTDGLVMTGSSIVKKDLNFGSVENMVLKMVINVDNRKKFNTGGCFDDMLVVDIKSNSAVPHLDKKKYSTGKDENSFLQEDIYSAEADKSSTLKLENNNQLAQNNQNLLKLSNDKNAAATIAGVVNNSNKQKEKTSTLLPPTSASHKPHNNADKLKHSNQKSIKPPSKSKLNANSNFRVSMPDLKSFKALQCRSDQYGSQKGSEFTNNDNLRCFYVSMCSQTKCSYCSNLLFDEQIISAWSTSDSNLESRCYCCETTFVPMLHVSIKKQERSNAESEVVGDFEVQYLSAFVLRKELENVVILFGEGCLAEPQFKTQHSILYWNMIWYFHRLKLPTHLDSFIINKKSEAEEKVQFELLWENEKFKKDFCTPMYKMWRHDSKDSKDLHVTTLQEKVLKDTISSLLSNNLSIPIGQLLEIRSANNKQGQLYRGLPQDIYMLSLCVLGATPASQRVDMKYETAYYDLEGHLVHRKMAADVPNKAVLNECRKVFGYLKLT